MKKIVVHSCNGSIRGPIITGWLKYYSGNDAEVYCVANKVIKVNSYASQVMTEAVIDLSKFKAVSLADLPDVEIDFVISVVPQSNTGSETLKGSPEYLVKEFRDLSAVEGEETELLNSFKLLRDEIEDFCFDFVNENIRQLIPDDFIDYAK